MVVRPALFFGLTSLLLVSALMNGALLFRTRSEVPSPRPSAIQPGAPRRAAEPGALSAASRLEAEPRASVSFDSVPGRAPAEEAPLKASSLAAPTAANSVLQDPKIAGIIEAQDRYGNFRKDLDKVFKVRGKIDEALYLDSVMRATVEFLEIPPALRARFSEGATGAAAAWARAKRERDDARQGLPPKDKNNPAYVQQKDAIDARYDENVKAATDLLKSQLDLSRPTHVEFAAKADGWLKNIAPRTGP